MENPWKETRVVWSASPTAAKRIADHGEARIDRVAQVPKLLLRRRDP
jgi:hypothetical protein